MYIIDFSALCIDHYPEHGLSKPEGNSLNFAIHAEILEYDIIAVTYSDSKLKKIIERNKSGKKIVVDFLHFDDSEILS